MLDDEKNIEIDNKTRILKKQVESHYNSVDDVKKRFKTYDDLEKLFSDSKNSMKQITYHLSEAISGPRINRVIQNIEETSLLSYRNAMNSLEESRNKIKLELDTLYKKIDDLERQIRNEYEDTLNKDKKIAAENNTIEELNTNNTQNKDDTIEIDSNLNEKSNNVSNN